MSTEQANLERDFSGYVNDGSTWSHSFMHPKEKWQSNAPARNQGEDSKHFRGEKSYISVNQMVGGSVSASHEKSG